MMKSHLLRWEDDELRITTMKRRIERAQRRAQSHHKADPVPWWMNSSPSGARQPNVSKVVFDASVLLAVIYQERGFEKLTPGCLAVDP